MACFLSFTVFTLFFTHFSIFFNTINGVFIEEVVEDIAIKRDDKMTHLHFYFHDIVGGKNPSVVRIAGPPDSFIGNFGNTMMADDLLTEGPKPTSKLVGKAQGLYAMAAQNDMALLMVMNFVFLEVSIMECISILGRNAVLNDQREMPIVGGNGFFRFARGYALAHTISADFSTGDAIVEYNVYVRA
ncbi:dirigent protein 21 [Quercus suber]|uniref:dirigent protein 21 n=1 Tax=Quercus suber TaxID=58331 RepID=UPI0032DE306F